MVGVKPETVTKAAKSAITDGRLYRCLSCNALCELHVDISSEMLKPGGELYNIAVQTHGPLKEGLSYSFPAQDLVCVFDAERDTLVAVQHKVLWISSKKIYLWKYEFKVHVPIESYARARTDHASF